MRRGKSVHKAAMSGGANAIVPSAWTAAHVGQLQKLPPFPMIDAKAATPAFADFDVWDSWPIQSPDGRTANFGGFEYWFMLSSPKFDDPGKRHDQARIRLIAFRDGVWTDCGHAMPDGLSPGSREWAGSAVLEADGRVALYFTAAGRRGEPHTFEQRLFVARATLIDAGQQIARLVDWSIPQELVQADGHQYVIARQAMGVPGAIKAFRDPAYFRDPADGREYILFTGSAAWSDHPYNGLIGIAEMRGDEVRLLPPLLHAVGLNNELERPHIIFREGQYYLFWSTQRRTFDPAGPSGPNGLYGAVSRSIGGPWSPLNGSGLVAGNPESEPLQIYSWWVLGEGDVIGFIDHWGVDGRSFENQPALLRQQFGGTPSPRYRLHFSGNTVTLTV
jgi:levansucrase